MLPLLMLHCLLEGSTFPFFFPEGKKLMGYMFGNKRGRRISSYLSLTPFFLELTTSQKSVMFAVFILHFPQISILATIFLTAKISGTKVSCF